MTGYGSCTRRKTDECQTFSVSHTGWWFCKTCKVYWSYFNFWLIFVWIMKCRHRQTSFARLLFIFRCRWTRTAVIWDTVTFKLFKLVPNERPASKYSENYFLNVISCLVGEILSFNSASPVSLYMNSFSSWPDRIHLLNLNSNGSTSTEYSKEVCFNVAFSLVFNM